MRLPSPCTFVLAAIFLLGCHKRGRDQDKVLRDEAVPVTVGHVESMAWDKEVAVNGTVFAKDEAALSAEVEGMVEKTLVDFGDRVQAGQILATIDTGSYEALAAQAAANLARARAFAANAEQTLTRTQSLGKSGIAPQSDLDQATAGAEQARAEVKAAEAAEAVARLNMKRSKVPAPFDGAIGQRLVGRGDFVHVGSPLFQVVSDSVLKFIFQVPEKFAAGVRKKQTVRFSVDAYPGRTFTAGVYLISPTVNTTTRAFSVGALVTNVDFTLKANTFARGSLVLEEKTPTTVVPLEAVFSFAGVTKAFITTNGVVQTRQVQLGRIKEGLQEIVAGLNPGETVILSGQSKLHDGSKVRVKTETAKR
jgi:RND family efflux transporter MFP subunit